jgi:hypothetical protein
LQTATQILSEAIQVHGNNHGEVIEQLKRASGADHYMYRMNKNSAVDLLKKSIEASQQEYLSMGRTGEWAMLSDLVRNDYESND